MSVFRRHGLARIAGVLRRNAWQAVPTVIGIVALNFVLLELVPGDAADVIAAESGSATEEGMAQLRRHFGLDLPMLERLWRYLTGIAQFDLGMSPRHNAPVAQLILDRLGNTLLLMGTALGIAVCAGVLLGVLMSARAGKWQDRLLSVVALLLYSTPSFWLGLMAIVLFSVKLGWLPTGGSYTIGAGLTGWAAFVDGARHLVLPALATSGFFIAIRAPDARVHAGGQPPGLCADRRVQGLGPGAVTFRHVLRNALIPVTTVAGMHFGALLGGATVIETVFSWPGLGRLALESVLARDYAVLLGILFLSSLLVIVANMLVDLLQAWLDPRIRLR